MSDQAIEQVEQTAEEAMAEMMAGYSGNARAEEAPEEQEEDEPSAEQDETVVEADDPPEPNQLNDLTEAMTALKAQVAAAQGDSQTIRKLHGEIGNINRTLKQLQTSKEYAPVDDELTAALKEADAIAQEYPELAAPLVKAIKAMNEDRKTQPQAQPVDISERVSEQVRKIREFEARESLAEEHPDFETVRGTQAFLAWESQQTPEYQKKLRTTWNPAVVAKGLTLFKESLKESSKTKEQKTNRLATATATQSTASKVKSSVISDEEALSIGYNSGLKRLQNKR